MKKYTFSITLTGYGDNADEAWQDATEATDLDSDPTPDESDYEVEDFEDGDDMDDEAELPDILN